jgi:hypothetical protein
MTLCFNWASRHEGVLGKWRYNHAFLTSTLEGGERSASQPDRFTPRERAAGTHWIGGWLSPRAGLDTVVNRKIPSPCRDSNPRSSTPYVCLYMSVCIRLSGSSKTGDILRSVTSVAHSVRVYPLKFLSSSTLQKSTVPSFGKFWNLPVSSVCLILHNRNGSDF